MKDGHPYLTAELDLQRADQRRTLRLNPDWLIGSAHCETPTAGTLRKRARDALKIPFRM